MKALFLLLLLGCHTQAPAPAATTSGPTAAASVWTCPMHPSIRLPAPGNCPICGMTLVSAQAEDAQHGVVAIDEARRQQFGIRTETVAAGPLDVEVRALGQIAADP